MASRGLAKSFAAKLIAAILIVGVAFVGFYYLFLSPLDVTSDPALNGGSEPDAIFVTVAPVYLVGKSSLMNEGEGGVQPYENGKVLLPMGTRLRVVEVLKHRMIYADNVPLTSPTGQLIDGPLAGTTVWMDGISKRGEENHKVLIVDPEILRREERPSP